MCQSTASHALRMRERTDTWTCVCWSPLSHGSVRLGATWRGLSLYCALSDYRCVWFPSSDTDSGTGCGECIRILVHISYHVLCILGPVSLCFGVRCIICHEHLNACTTRSSCLHSPVGCWKPKLNSALNTSLCYIQISLKVLPGCVSLLQ